jgi:hypothetical protein
VFEITNTKNFNEEVTSKDMAQLSKAKMSAAPAIHQLLVMILNGRDPMALGDDEK